jgi:hypothetical protein
MRHLLGSHLNALLRLAKKSVNNPTPSKPKAARPDNLNTPPGAVNIYVFKQWEALNLVLLIDLKFT